MNKDEQELNEYLRKKLSNQEKAPSTMTQSCLHYSPQLPSNLLEVTNDWGDTIGYVNKPADYYEEPGY